MVAITSDSWPVLARHGNLHSSGQILWSPTGASRRLLWERRMRARTVLVAILTILIGTISADASPPKKSSRPAVRTSRPSQKPRPVAPRPVVPRPAPRATIAPKPVPVQAPRVVQHQDVIYWVFYRISPSDRWHRFGGYSRPTDAASARDYFLSLGYDAFAR